MKKGTHVRPCITQAQKDRVMEYIRIGEEEAVSIINEVRWRLTCAIYSGNQELALRMCRQVDVGMTFIKYFRNTLGIPFGGVKETGYGREYCIEAMKDWSTAKVIQMPSRLAPVPSWPPVNELLPLP
jgi:acyl-CoA reductase-like NAD-dependent aldehyde dehydrogenase